MAQPKILLIYCSTPGQDESFISQPLGVLYLAAILEKAGVSVKCRDERIHTREEIRAAIDEAEIVGFSAMTPYIERAFDWARYAREKDKMTLIGGPHATVDPNATLESRLFDVVFIREAEITIQEALPVLFDKEKLKDVKGVGFFDEAGEKVITPERPFNLELDKLPVPARHLLPMDAYFRHNRERLIYVYTSRGCPYSCVFCQKKVYGRKFRSRSNSNICDELEQLKNEYDPGAILFIDELFTCQPKRVYALCDEMIRRKLELNWCCETRVDRIDYPMMIAMRRAGLRRMYFGVESGSPASLKTLNKRFTVEQVVTTLKAARRANIWTKIFLIFGTPNETLEDIELTARMLRKAHPDMVRSALFNPLIGSPSFDIYHDRIDMDLIFKEFVASNSTPYRHENFTIEELNELSDRVIAEYEAWYDKPAQRFGRWLARSRFYLSHPRDTLARIRGRRF
ncbi:MAG: radical SAM protein [Planctomycetota bacterium]